MAVARAVDSLARLYKSIGAFARAEPLYRRSLEIREARLGKDSLEVAGSLHNLAALLMNKGDYAAAEPLYQRSLKIRKALLAPEHPAVSYSLASLGALAETLEHGARQPS